MDVPAGIVPKSKLYGGPIPNVGPLEPSLRIVRSYRQPRPASLFAGRIEVRADLDATWDDRPRLVGTPRVFLEFDVHNRVQRTPRSRLRQPRRGTVRNRLRPGREHDDSPVHLGMTHPAELRALDGVRSGDVSPDPEDVRNPRGGVNFDPEVGDVEGMDHVLSINPQ